MIVRKRAELEEFPEAIMLELQFCAALHVAGEQREHNVRALSQSQEQFLHPG